MDNLVTILQTQHHELLAAHAATSNRDTAQNIVQQLKSISEELELMAAAATPSPHASALSADFYASYLLLVLLSRDLNDARFLWKRIPTETKESSEELRNVWEIGKALWQRNLAAAYFAMDYDWSPSLQSLVEALKSVVHCCFQWFVDEDSLTNVWLLRSWCAASTREDTAELLSLAYSTIPVADVALALGFARQEDALQYCASLKWGVSEAEHLVLPKPMANVRRGPSMDVDLAQLDTLSKTVLHLEQNTVVKLP